MITDEEFERIKEEYNIGNIQIGVELSLARKNINDAGNKVSLLWSSSFTIMMIFSFCIRNIFYWTLGNSIWNNFFYSFILVYGYMFN